MAARIVGVGKHLPARVMTNLELEAIVETNDKWIVDRTGIRERRIAGEQDSVASMGIEAARMALATAAMPASDIQLVVCATCSGDNIFPATASLIQQAIGARHAAAFDVNAACTGFMTALATGVQFIEGGMYERVLVVGSDVLSRFLDWTDRSTCILFGDGAGAVVLEKAASGGASSFVIESDGSTAELLYVRGPGGAPASVVEGESFCIHMNGPEVFKYAVRAMEDAARKSVAGAGLKVEDIDYLLPHQANHRIMSAVARGLGLPNDRLLCNVDRYGNTSAASIPIALCEAWEEGRFKQGDKLALVAVGGGLVWAASVVEWTGLGSELRT